MARSYKRDARGRFSGSGGGSSGRKAAKAPKATKGSNKTAPTAPKGKSSAPPPPAWSSAMKAAAKKGRASMPVNKIAASPRRFNAEEAAYARLATSSKFRSDASRRREMQRLGFNGSQENLMRVAASVRKKTGNSSQRVGNDYVVSKAAIKAKLSPAKKRKRK